MAVIHTNPANKNMLNPTGFRFAINRTPHLNYFTYNAPIPTLTLGDYDQETPFVRLPYPGDKLRYEPLSIRFRVDEDLQNYLEIHNWLVSLGYPENYEQSAYRGNRGKQLATSNIYSDGSLFILSSHKQANIQVDFKRLIPISLSEINFDTQDTNIEYLEATATFRYYVYTINKL